jgi:O-antigen polymerase
VVQYYGLGPGDHFLLVKKTLPYGSFQQKNVMTIFMVTGMGIGLFLIGKDHVLASSRLKRWLVLLPPLTGSIIIMAIKSKAGYLGLLVMFPLLLPTINVKEKLYQRWFMLLVTGLIIGYVSPRAYQFFQSGAQPEGQTETQKEAGLYTRDLGSQIETVNTRIDMWEITFDIWKDNPLTGIGYGKWPRIFREYHAFRRANATGSDYFMGEYLDHPHNETLLWLSEGGIAPFLGLLIFAGGYLIMVFRLKWKNVLSCLALVMPIFLHTQFELPFDISLAHWIVFLTLCHFPDDQQNIRYRYNLHKTMIIPALMIPLMVYYYMGTTLRINSTISRFEHTGMKNYDLLLQVKDSGALHLKYDNYVLKTMLDLGMDTKNEEALQLFLEKAEEFVQRSPILHVYNGMMKALLVLGREKEAKAMVARARYLYPDTNEAWLQPEN